ncbi:pimeloyl-ACP methyl ester carboxylesterase [Kribbella voronezhensis]|uniref:Pimeloyl-ACP methyl ester carboxylesterase n=1 Tax=Kribbella voronezhensis TaxID=2512212 RepID=A0A4R7TBN0_9ACTN|nr:alpha/beta hydrolase [Kribbella voronezhensis]TDU88738.1 pimeloyl-ACP methyl ester carboxylesterase [Kribbella voronezhensis]
MTVSCWVVGSGPAVLLVHAGVADARMWRRQVEELAADHQVITMDLRGYGETPLEVGAKYSDAGDLLAVLDEVGATEVTAVGASFGGYVVQQAASRQPERFSRLVLICAPTDNVEPTDDLRAVWAEENQLLEAGDVAGATDLMVRSWLGPEADDEARELLRAMQGRAYELQLAAGDDVTNEEYPVEPEKLSMPVRLITGEHDFAFFTNSADYLAERLPASERIHLPWAGHLPTLERPEEGTALIRAALS